MNKLMKEYLEFIGEAPIEDISHIGNSETATNFTKPEIKMLKSEKYEKRLRNAFSKTPFIFDIVFLYHDDFDASSKKDNRKIGEYIPKNKILDDYDGIKGKPGVITFVAQGNLSPENRIPMTPWILAHKIGHALEDANEDIPHSISYDKFYNLKTKLQKTAYNNLSDENHDNLFSFKTWSKLKNTFDDELLCELIALYLLQGKITANTNDNKILELIDKMNTEIYNIFKSLEGYILTEV